MGITIGNKYFAKRGLLDVEAVDGTIRIVEFTVDDESVDTEYRAVIEEVNLHQGAERITMIYAFERRFMDKWITENGKIVSTGTMGEFVKIATGMPEYDTDITHTEGILNLEYTTSYNHVMLYFPVQASQGIREALQTIQDAFFEMNFVTKQLPKYKNV